MLVVLLFAFAIHGDDYVFIRSQSTPASIQVMNSTENSLMIGYIDENGTFVCNEKRKSKLFGNQKKSVNASDAPAKVTPHFLESSPIDFNVINRTKYDGEPLYEYRTGKLILGTINRNGAFIPDEDSQPIDFTEYKYSSDSLRIYNLPGRYVTYSEYLKLQKEKK